MTGFELYTKHSKRDFSGSPDDLYAQTLGTLLLHLKYDLYPLLEKAERLNKRLDIIDVFNDGVLQDEYTIENVIFV